MSWIGAIGSVAGSALGLGGGALSAKQQRKLAEEQDQRNLAMSKEMAGINYGYGEQAADAAHQRSLGLLEANKQANSYQEKVNQAKEAGLSIGMLYGGGGAGGSASGGTGAQGSGASGMAAPTAAPKASGLEVMAAMNELKLAEASVRKVANESKLVNAQKENIEADTQKKSSETATTDTMRETSKELMRQQAIAQWIENEEKHWSHQDQNNKSGLDAENSILNASFNIEKASPFNERMTAEVAEILSKTKGNEALAELNNAKKRGYWQELMNATKDSNSREIQANAMKLAAEWSTGEYTNWKTWADMATQAVGAVSELAKNIATAGKTAASGNLINAKANLLK